MFEFERLGLPVAYVDTAGRVPFVWRDGGTFVIEYSAMRYMIGDPRRLPPETAERQRRLVRGFERFGFHRALGLAGARAGDLVRAGRLEVRLWEYPEAEHAAHTDGIANYDYVVARNIARLSDEELAAEAERVAPLLLARLRN